MIGKEELSGDKLQIALKEYESGLVGSRILQPESLKNRKKFIQRLEVFLCGKAFNQDTARDFIKFISTTKQGLASKPSTIATYNGKLRGFCQFLVDEGYIQNNFCKKIPKPKEEAVKAHIAAIKPELAQRAIILGTSRGKYDNSKTMRVKDESRLALMFALTTGRRRSEILSLRSEDLFLDDDPPFYWATLKGGGRQIFEVPPVKSLIDVLRARSKREKIFEVTADTLNKHLQNGLRQLGITKKVTMHDLRHIFALERLRRGESIYHVSRLLGHKRIEITAKYYTPYVMTDYSSTLRNSTIIRHGLSLQEVIDDVGKLVRERVRDDRFESVQLKMHEDGVELRIPYSKIGLREMKKN